MPLRATLEQKRKELNDLMEQFAAANLEERRSRGRARTSRARSPPSFAQAAGGAAPPPQTGPKPLHPRGRRAEAPRRSSECRGVPRGGFIGDKHRRLRL